VPALFGSLLATAPVSDDVELLARLRAQGETQCSNPASGGLVGQPGAQAVDLGLERRWTPPGFLRRARLLFLLENVFDRAVFDKCGLPQAGRTARLGLSFG
jgi:hypothetical protein